MTLEPFDVGYRLQKLTLLRRASFVVRGSSLARPRTTPLQCLSANRSDQVHPGSTVNAAAQEQPGLSKPAAAGAADQTRLEQAPGPQNRGQHASSQQQPQYGSKRRTVSEGRAQTSNKQIAMQMTTYIKDQQQAARQSVPTAPPGRIMAMYTSRMDQLCSQSSQHLDHIHIGLILYGTAQIYAADKACHRDSLTLQLYGPGFTKFLTRLLEMMLPLLPTVTYWTSSNILLSFSRLNLNPDDLVPGTVDSLAQQFIKDMRAASGQTYSSVMLACVSLKLDPCKGALLRAVMHSLSTTDMTSFAATSVANITHSLVKLRLHPSPELLRVLNDSFLSKMQLPDARERPSAKALAIVIWAFATLSGQPSAQMLSALNASFLDKMQSPDAREHPNAQDLATLIWAFATLPSAQPSAQLLDALCGCFVQRLQSEAAHQQPNAQDIANVAWALHKLKHAPPAAFAAAVLERMLHLCQAAQQHKPRPQAISNFLLACAELRLAIGQEQARVLLTHLLADNRSTMRDLANSAWSLAVSGLLQLSTFKQLLNCLDVKVARRRAPNITDMRQLFQSLDWLRPTSDAKLQDHQEWSKLEAQLQRLGRRSQPQQKPHDCTSLHNTLTELGLQYSVGSVVQGYTVSAVVHPQHNIAQPILCNDFPFDCFTNEPSRLTGRELFKHEMLSREGILINIPAEITRQGTNQLAEYLKSKIESIAGGSLDAYRQNQPSIAE